MTEQKSRAFADVARGVLIAVAFTSFAVGIYHAPGPAVAETPVETTPDTAFSVEVKASIADFVIDIAKLSGVVSITEAVTDDSEQCVTDLTSI